MAEREFIEREAVYDALSGMDYYTPTDATRAISAVRAIRAADVAPVVHGKWIEHGLWIDTTQPLGWRAETCAECSVCGTDFVLDERGMEDMQNLMLYCPNCGARMDMEDE